MDRKTARLRFLAVGSAAFGSIGMVRAPAGAAQFSYKLGDPDPLDFPVPVRMIQMANAVKTETNGRMQIEVFPNSVLGSSNSMLAQLRLGSIQLLTMNHSLYASVVPVAQINSLGFIFTSSQQALRALDGPLGAYIRKEFALKGMYVFEKTFETGFRETTSSTHPIRTIDDFAGFKIRTLPAAIFVDLFKTLGASPIPLDANEMYTAMQTHIVDGMESPLGTLEAFRVFEVQRYLSLTNHIWGGYWLTANAEAWNALPADIQAIVQRNVEKYTLLERNDIHILNGSLADKMKRQGMAFNAVDLSGVRGRLGPYYARWKSELGTTAGNLLEAEVGKLG